MMVELRLKRGKPLCAPSRVELRQLIAQRLGDRSNALLDGAFAKAQFIKIYRDVLARGRIVRLPLGTRHVDANAHAQRLRVHLGRDAAKLKERTGG